MKLYDPNDPEQHVAMNRRNARLWAPSFWPAVLLLLAILIGDALFNQAWYGDWSCMFVNCVRAQDVKHVEVGP